MSKHAIGLLDTSVVIDLDRVDSDRLPDEIAIAAITLAELAGGPHGANDRMERARRQEHLQRVESTFNALPFDDHAARAYGQIYAAVSTGDRKPADRRAVDLLIAATALAERLPLFTRNPERFDGLSELIEIVAV